MNLKQLSDKLGLSQTTVSRALNGYPEVSETTRRRVQDAARTFNYSPSVRAKGLATGRAFAIGHVIPISTRHEIVNPIFGDFIAGAGETYTKHGYEMVLSVVPDAEEEKVYKSLLTRHTVDGVIVHGPRMNDSRIPLLAKLGLPFAVHGRASGCTLPYTWLDVNNRNAMERATEYLIDLGHRRIGLVNGREDMDFAHRRRDGYMSALHAHDIPLDPAIMRSGEMSESAGHRGAEEMLALPEPPTAIVCASMISALGVRRAIEERGLKMGRDVSVVTYDDMLSYLRIGEERPIFTAVRSSVRDAGRQLAEMLLAAIADPDARPQQHLLEAELIIGTSTGPAPDKD